MLKTIIQSFGSVEVNLEVEYTGTETIKYIIENNQFSVLPENSPEENFLTLSLPTDFEKMCAVQNDYHIRSCTPSTITFHNNKTCDIEVFSLGKFLVCEDGLLIMKSFSSMSFEDGLHGMRNYKTHTSEKIENTTDITKKEKLQNLLTEITFVIDSMEADDQFPYMLYKFDTE